MIGSEDNMRPASLNRSNTWGGDALKKRKSQHLAHQRRSLGKQITDIANKRTSELETPVSGADTVASLISESVHKIDPEGGHGDRRSLYHADSIQSVHSRASVQSIHSSMHGRSR